MKIVKFYSKKTNKKSVNVTKFHLALKVASYNPVHGYLKLLEKVKELSQFFYK